MAALAAVPRPILARIGATRLLLQEVSATAAHKDVSALQKAALEQLLADHSLGAEQRAALAEDLIKIQWHGQDGLALLSTLTSQASKPAAKRRRCGQSYETIVQFLTEGEWNTLTTDGHPASVKLHVLLSACVSLGLRTPTEPCLKFLASVWMLLAMGIDEIRRHSCEQKAVMLQTTKVEFDKLRRSAPDPVEHIQELPHTPVALLKDHPLLYNGAFASGKGDPVACPLDVRLVHEVDRSFTCRNSGRSYRPLAANATPTINLQSDMSASSSGFQQMANVFMSRLESLQQSQNRMLEVCMASTMGRRPDLASLAQTPHTPERRLSLLRLPTIAVGEGGATPHRPLQFEQSEFSTPRPAASPQALVARPEGEASPAVSVAESQEDSLASAPANPAMVLDMILERNEEKRALARQVAKSVVMNGSAAAAIADEEGPPAKAAKVAPPAKVAKAAPPAKVAKVAPPLKAASVAKVAPPAKAAKVAASVAKVAPPAKAASVAKVAPPAKAASVAKVAPPAKAPPAKAAVKVAVKLEPKVLQKPETEADAEDLMSEHYVS